MYRARYEKHALYSSALSSRAHKRELNVRDESQENFPCFFGTNRRKDRKLRLSFLIIILHETENCLRENRRKISDRVVSLEARKRRKNSWNEKHMASRERAEKLLIKVLALFHVGENLWLMCKHLLNHDKF